MSSIGVSIRFRRHRTFIGGGVNGRLWSGAVRSTDAANDRSSPCEPEAAHLLSAENQPANGS